MQQFPGFEVRETLYVGRRTLVYRAWDVQHGRAVILKSSRNSAPDELARLTRESQLGQLVGARAVPEVLGLSEHARSYLLLLEDFGAVAVAKLLQDGPLDPRHALSIGLGAVRCLAALHAQEVVHKDISPGNVLVNPETGEVRLCDLGLATRIPRTNQGLRNPSFIEGTLAYMSPEQTGRMNRCIDYRTDFYSFGATLYEMLTGRLPFPEQDPTALIHAHIARKPTPPHELRPGIPAALSAVVLRMLEKSAEARYQSAAGIAADLEHCIAELDDTGTIDPFPPGREDRSPTFSVTQQLYGRTEETRALLDAFARSAAGTSALLPVCGAPGVGKSMLVNEVHRSMVGCRGLFIEGKYDQLRMTDPLSALRQALDGLLGRLLAEPEERLGAWRSRLLDALGENGQILIDFLPAAAHVLGPQAQVIELPPTRARERFDRTLIAAIQVFADTDHPLVIFLDDLQWVDPASLRLLEGLLADPNSRALLVIGAYRDNELGASHPLLDTLRRLEDQGQALPPIRLNPLGAEDTLALVADSFERDAASVASLASVIHQKTAGNPFFMVQFLYRLADGGAVTRDPESGDWVWDLQAIAGFDAIETAVELMLTRLDEYDAQTRQLLRLAGCLGALFDLRTLSTIADRSPRDVSRGLWKPVREGLVLPLDDAWQYYLWLGREGEDAPPPDSIRYRFAHDRVQEAALASIPEDERAEVSLRIGRLLLADADAAEREARIFDLVDHLSLGARLLQTRSERDELASLCLAAGRKARGATAFPAAREYLERGVELLGDDGWERDFALMFQFHRERIEVEFALGHLDLAIEAFDVVRRRSHTLHQLGDIYQLMIRIHLTADEVVEGLRLGREVLARFGLELPAEPDAIAAIVEDERARIAGLIGDRNILDLVNEPEMTDTELAVCLGLLHETWTCAVMAGDFAQVTHTAAKITRLSLEHGYNRFSACGFVAHAAVLSFGGRYEEAKAFGLLSMEVCHRFNDVFIIPKVHNTFANFTNHWVQHIRTNIPIYEESYRNCLLSGDRWWGAWAAGWVRTARLIAGDPIQEVLRYTDRVHGYIEASGYQPLYWLSVLDRQLLLNLAGRTEAADSLDGEGRTEAEIRAALTTMGFGFGLYLLNTYKAVCLLLHGQVAAAPALIADAEATREHIPGLMPYADWWFFAALVWTQTEGGTGANSDRVREHVRCMQRWAEVCPENFEHRLLLMRAELARIEARPCTDLYEQAIAAARRDGYVQHAAVAAELAARHHLQKGREHAAMGYLITAHQLYTRWGAAAKVGMLEARYPELTTAQAPAGAPGPTLETTTTKITLDNVDLDAILGAAQMISGALQLDALLDNLLNISLRNAGAERAALVVLHDGRPEVAATATADDVRTGIWEPLEASERVPRSIVQFCLRIGETLVLDDALNDNRFGHDPYIAAHRVRSALAVPTFNKGAGVGVMYLENNLATAAFTPERVQPLRLLSTQAAIALENAMLYDTLESKVVLRTRQLAEKNGILEQKNAEILKAQAQLVQSEKMASLGQLVAGVAHEMNNPISFIHSGLPSLRRDVGKLQALLPDSGQDPAVDKLTTRIGRLLDAMGDGTRRVAETISHLRTFSRLDEAEYKEADLHQALDSTLALLHSKLRDRIEVVRDYGDIPPVECFISQLNQVFMNVLANAAQAIDGEGTITIRTSRAGADRVQVEIADTGRGMTPEVQQKIFDPFFTTKDVGEGTGLGLAISHGVIDKHRGRIEVDSTPGVGTCFRIVLPVSGRAAAAGAAPTAGGPHHG